MYRIVVTLSFLGLLFTSCKKEYTCSCVQTYTTTAYTQFGTYHPQSTTVNSYNNTYKAKEDVAVSSCKASESISVQTYGSGEAQRTATETVECELY